MGLINDKIIIHKYGPCYNLSLENYMLITYPIELQPKLKKKYV